MKTLILCVLFCQIAYNLVGQTKKVYGRDFDYKTLSIKDTLSGKKLPSYYVCCTYSNGVLSDIEVYQKEEWMTKYLHTHAHIFFKDRYMFFVYDPGKMKYSYGQLFGKKVKEVDTAMLINDTLVFKNTNKYRIALNYATSIFSDSISIENFFFSLSKYDKKGSSLFGFKNYFQWPSFNGFTRFYHVLITPKMNEVVKARKMIDDGTIDYSNNYSTSQEYFQKRSIPASLFWIEHLGIIGY